MKEWQVYWRQHHLIIIVLILFVVITVGGFTFLHMEIQDQQQSLSALSVKVDSLTTQLQTVQQQTSMIRRNLTGKRIKKLPTPSPTFGL
jgi:uncharacterized protein YpmB